MRATDGRRFFPGPHSFVDLLRTCELATHVPSEVLVELVNLPMFFGLFDEGGGASRQAPANSPRPATDLPRVVSVASLQPDLHNNPAITTLRHYARRNHSECRLTEQPNLALHTFAPDLELRITKAVLPHACPTSW
jgi:hypothetical protein